MPADFVTIKKESSSDGAVPSSESHYPYGTSLDLQGDMIDELGVSGLTVGDVVEVHGFAVVERKSEHEDGDGVDRSMSIQLTQLKLSGDTPDAAEELYGGAS